VSGLPRNTVVNLLMVSLSLLSAPSGAGWVPGMGE
jgi:hypothetical protein